MKKIQNSIIVFSLLFIGNYSFAQWWKIGAVQNLGTAINSSGTEESMPVFVEDSSTLFFTKTFDEKASNGKLDQEIWFAKRNADRTFAPAQPVSGLNTKMRNSAVSFGQGGRLYTLNTALNNNTDFKGLTFVTQNGAGWSKTTDLPIPNLEIKGNYYSFFVVATNDLVLISYNGPESLGEEDLYVSILENGSWSTPLHMGNQINSEGFEISPFLNASKDTLYFSSNGFGGYGDADIFYAVKNGAWNNWSKPVNLGDKINSAKFDAYFIKSRTDIFWSSNRDSELSDIYHASILFPPALDGTIAASNVSKFNLQDGKIDLTPIGGVAPLSFKWSNNLTTEDIAHLAPGNYNVTITDAIGQTKTLMATITQPDPPVNVVIRLPEVRYAVGKHELLIDATINSKDSLNYVYDLLMKYPNMHVELMSHTDARGSDKANQELSQRRAQECVRYLTQEKGIDPSRLVPKGKGEFVPAKWIDPNTGKEVILTEAYINKFKKSNPQLFEYLHQLNRRTEIRILSI